MADDLIERVDMLRWQLRSRIQRSRYILMAANQLAARTRKTIADFRRVQRELNRTQRDRSVRPYRHERA